MLLLIPVSTGASFSQCACSSSAPPPSLPPSPSRSHRLEATLSGHTQPVRSLAASLDSSKLISCSADGTVRTWDPQSGSCQVLEAHQSWVNGCGRPGGAPVLP